MHSPLRTKEEAIKHTRFVQDSKMYKEVTRQFGRKAPMDPKAAEQLSEEEQEHFRNKQRTRKTQQELMKEKMDELERKRSNPQGPKEKIENKVDKTKMKLRKAASWPGRVVSTIKTKQVEKKLERSKSLPARLKPSMLER